MSSKQPPGPKKRSCWKMSDARRKKHEDNMCAALAEGYSVTEALRRSGLSKATFYDWRKADLAFDKRVTDAMESGTDVLEDEARRRAVEGELEPVGFYQGAPSAHVQRRSDTLLMFLLKARRPEKFRENHHVALDAKVDLSDMTDEQLRARLADVLNGNPALLKQALAGGDEAG